MVKYCTYDFSPMLSIWRKTTGLSSQAFAVRHRTLQPVSENVPMNKLTHSSNPFLSWAPHFLTIAISTTTVKELRKQNDYRFWCIILTDAHLSRYEGYVERRSTRQETVDNLTICTPVRPMKCRQEQPVGLCEIGRLRSFRLPLTWIRVNILSQGLSIFLILKRISWCSLIRL